MKTQFTTIQHFATVWNLLNGAVRSEDDQGYGPLGSMQIDSDDIHENRALVSLGGDPLNSAITILVEVRDGRLYQLDPETFSLGDAAGLLWDSPEDPYAHFLQHGFIETFPAASLQVFDSWEDFFASEEIISNLHDERDSAEGAVLVKYENLLSQIKNGTLWA